ncbi:MAG: SpoIID/LytB domain-containing protein [Bacteroidales bacterium]
MTYEKMEAPNIEVGILRDKELNLFLHGKYHSDSCGGYFIGALRAKWSDSGMFLECQGRETISCRMVELIPGNMERDLADVEAVRIGINFHWDERKKLKFQGSMKFVWHEEGIQLINVLPIETYLRSVISSEMSATSSLELLKAHAIVSRSWLMAQLFKPPAKKVPAYKNPEETKDSRICWYDRVDHQGFHVCADDHCQRYYGHSGNIHPNVIRAIRETTGVVLVSEGHYCDTRYSKSCGGMTETFENCWEPEPKSYLTSLRDHLPDSGTVQPDLRHEKEAIQWIDQSPEAFCNTTDQHILEQVLTNVDKVSLDFYRWTKSYSQNELTLLLHKKTGIDFGNIVDIEPLERGPSGRLIRIRICGTKKKHIFGKELEIRRILSETHLYSSAFYVIKEGNREGVPEKFIFKGAGWGHGVGLCQIGAAVMGEKGYTHKQILEHYFRGVSMQTIY